MQVWIVTPFLYFGKNSIKYLYWFDKINWIALLTSIFWLFYTLSNNINFYKDLMQENQDQKDS